MLKSEPWTQYSWSTRQKHYKRDTYTSIAGRVWYQHNYLTHIKADNDGI